MRPSPPSLDGREQFSRLSGRTFSLGRRRMATLYLPRRKSLPDTLRVQQAESFETILDSIELAGRFGGASFCSPIDVRKHVAPVNALPERSFSLSQSP